MNSVLEILELVETATGSNTKRDILRAHAGNDLLKTILVSAVDKMLKYNVRTSALSSAPVCQSVLARGDDEVMSEFMTLLITRLASEELSGSAAVSALHKALAPMSELQRKWAQRIVLKNLRCGTQTSSVEEIWPGALKRFLVAQAARVEAVFTAGTGFKLSKKISYPRVLEPKYDGNRRVILKRNGVVTLFSRNGKDKTSSLPGIVRAITECRLDNFMADAESLGDTLEDSTSVLNSTVNLKDDSAIRTCVFDAMSIEDWDAQSCVLTLPDRAVLADAIVESVNHPNFIRVPTEVVNSDVEVITCYEKCLSEGFEGVMLKDPNHAYVWGDRGEWVYKLKPVMDVDTVIVGTYPGRMGTKHEGKFGGLTLLLHSGETCGIANFTDSVREAIVSAGESIIGKLVVIECQPDPGTESGLTRDGSARNPRFQRFRDWDESDGVMKAVYDRFKENNRVLR